MATARCCAGGLLLAFGGVKGTRGMGAFCVIGAAARAVAALVAIGVRLSVPGAMMDVVELHLGREVPSTTPAQREGSEACEVDGSIDLERLPLNFWLFAVGTRAEND